MTEFITEQVVDFSNYAHLSSGVDAKRGETGLHSADKELNENENGPDISQSVRGAQNSQECEQSFVMDSEYHEHESARLEQDESPDNASKPECTDPDVKPTHSYIALIAMAILSCSNKKMILGDIYQYISDNFPYYRNKDKSWRNSIRHNLSLNECFIKAGRSENGKGNYWAIHPANLEDFANGDFRRRRARRRVRRSNPLKFGGSSAQSAYFRGIGFSSHSSFFPYRADDCRMHPSLTYVRPTKKSFAIDSIMGSSDSPYLYSPISVRSYPSLSLQSGREHPGSSAHSLSLFHSSPSLSSCVAEVATTPAPGYPANSLDSSAFTAYVGSKGVVPRGQNSRPKSWQETLSKLQEQLRKVTP